MITYRFLSPAEEEMTEAALFYEIASAGLGNDFLDDVQRAVNRLSAYPQCRGVHRFKSQTDIAAPLSIQSDLRH